MKIDLKKREDQEWLADVSGYALGVVLVVAALISLLFIKWYLGLGFLIVALVVAAINYGNSKIDADETGPPEYDYDVQEATKADGTPLETADVPAVTARLGEVLALTKADGSRVDPAVLARIEQVLNDENLEAVLRVLPALDAAIATRAKGSDASGMVKVPKIKSIGGRIYENIVVPVGMGLATVAAIVIYLLASPSAAERVRDVLQPLTVHKTATGTDKVVVFSEELYAEVTLGKDGKTITLPVVEGARWVVEVAGQEPVFASKEEADSGKGDGSKVTTGYKFRSDAVISGGTIYLDPTDPSKLPSRKRPIPKN